MRIEIKAFDTLFFRDGKPFTMEDESWAEGIFPPPPSVIYGALRAAYFAQHPEDLGKANGDDDPTRNLKITDIVLLLDEQYRSILYPVPADCAVKKIRKSEYEKKEKKEDGYELHRMKIVPDNSYFSSKLLKPLWIAENAENDTGKQDKFESSAGFYLIRSDLGRYLRNGSLDEIYVEKLSEKILVEPKIGIGRDRQTKTSNDGRLYRLGMRRLKDLSFIVGFEGLDLPETGIIRLGGEGKTASYSKCSLNFSRHEIDEKSRRFVVYFKTPVIFENNGYYPDFFDENFACTLNGRKYRIVSMAMDKPLSIGGWDMKANKPKAMKKFVPAGSVYIVECDSEISLKDFGDDFASQEFCKEEYARQGYGLYLTGVYK